MLLFPKHAKTLKTATPGDATLNFMAQGQLNCKLGAVLGVLQQQRADGSFATDFAVVGRTLRPTPNYLIAFQGVPVPAGGTTYRVAILSLQTQVLVDGFQVIKDASGNKIVQVEVIVQRAAHMGTRDVNPVMQYPDVCNTINPPGSCASSGAVPANFYALGTTNDASSGQPLSAWLSPPGTPGTHLYDGTVVQGPPVDTNLSWSISFSADGGTYDLNLRQGSITAAPLSSLLVQAGGGGQG